MSLSASQGGGTLAAAGDGAASAEGQHPEAWWDQLEDPAENWIQFVMAVQSGDPSKTRPLTIKARNSKWTMRLWMEATAEGEEEGSSEMESDGMSDSAGEEGVNWYKNKGEDE